ncbi:MAG: HepT-like ribonuclease domain-containing protein [Actinomycetota bacterium]|nr:HepT-like ribonuclease domain-containing protein [Actinomycetota bacterium]
MRDDEARVLDIVETCDQLIDHIGRDRARFMADPVAQAAAQRWLEIIGEAAARLSDEFKASHPDVAWRDLVGTRNVLAHGYFNVDHSIVWSAVVKDVPELRQALAGPRPTGG